MILVFIRRQLINSLPKYTKYVTKKSIWLQHKLESTNRNNTLYRMKNHRSINVTFFKFINKNNKSREHYFTTKYTIKNDTGFYLNNHLPLFWRENYEILTNTPLHSSMSFNYFTENYFQILNDIDTVFTNEDFKLELFCKKDTFNFTPTTTINKIEDLPNNENLEFKNIIDNLIHFYKNNNWSRKLKKQGPTWLPPKLINWQLSQSFFMDNFKYLNLKIFKDTKVGKIKRLYLNIRDIDGESYIFRQHHAYLFDTKGDEFSESFRSISDDFKFFTKYDYSTLLKNENKMNTLHIHFETFAMNTTNFNNLLRKSVKLNYTPNDNLFFLDSDIIHTPFKFCSNDITTSQTTLEGFFEQKNIISMLLAQNDITDEFLAQNDITDEFLAQNDELFQFYKLNFFSPLKTEIKYKIFITPIEHIFTTVKTQTTDLFFNKHASYIFSKIISSFIIQHIGLFLHFKLFSFKPKWIKIRYKFKKKIFSFYKTNEIRRSLFENRKKIYIFKYVSRKSQYLASKPRFTRRNYNPNFDLYIKKKIELNVFNNLYFPKTFSNTKYTSDLLGYKRDTVDVIHSDIYKRFVLPPRHRQLEVRIPRLRFKPGYQRLWREYRAALADALRFRYIYQKQFTKFINTFTRNLKTYNLMIFECKAWKIILYSKLLPDIRVIDNFVSERLIYLNGRYLSTTDQNILVDDIIQIRISVWYYLYSKWVLSWNVIRVKKFKKLVHRKKIASSYKIMKSMKQKSRYTPLYIYNMRYDMSDVKPYLELDYLTLSFVFIYDNFILDVHSSNDVPEYRHFVYRMYNWKYVN